MLAYILALAVGLGSLGIYLAAFFLPEIHRKTDFYWSGLGLFYALVLWVCAGRITGGVLLGQIASVALLGWFGWQTLTLRRQLVPPTQQTEIPNPEVAAQKVLSQAESLKNNLRSKLSNVSLPAGVSQLPKKLGDLVIDAKDKIQGMLSGAKKPPNKPTKADITPPPPPPPVTPPTAATGEAVVPPRPIVTITNLDTEAKAEPTPPVNPAEAPSVEISAVNTTPTVPEASIVPEVTSIEAPSAIETVTSEPSPNASISSPFSDIASSQNEEVSGLKRPDPPDPKLVEESVEDAQAKNLPTSPPSDKEI